MKHGLQGFWKADSSGHVICVEQEMARNASLYETRAKKWGQGFGIRPLSPVCPILVKGIAEVQRESAVLDPIDLIFIPRVTL